MSFERKIKYYKNFRYLIFSIVTVGVPFIIWDILAEKRGDWMFNSDHIGGMKIFNLPAEEILFFITVPYSIIFLYETFIYYIKPKQITYNNKYLLIISFASLMVSIIFLSLDYTFTVFFFLSVVFFFIAFSKLSYIRNKYLIYFFLFTFIPFFIFNSLLTSLPVVIYNPDAIWGIRILTVPLEDFFYSLCLISGYLLNYEFAKEKWK
jgi:lycopene cyclase domain-containing protein